MRTIALPKNLVDLRKAPVDIHDIEKNIREFYLHLDIDEEEDVKTQCLDARGVLESARMFVRNLVSIEENKYMKECDKAYFFMQENLGRVDKRLNEVELENIDKLVIEEKYQGKKIVESPLLRRYMNSLVNCMEHLVYYPLKNALRKYQEADETEEGEKIVKEKNLFLYFLFLELLHASESLGAITADKSARKMTTLSTHQVSPTEEKYDPKKDGPSALPKEVATESVGTEGGQEAEDFFGAVGEDDEESPPDDLIFEDDDMEVTEENI